jgi:AcrR family transcriptional regulator
VSELERSTRGTPRGDRRKTAIVNAAMALFSQHGYRGTSLASIAGAAGITQPGLLHHFRSKEELLVAVLQERDRLTVEQLKARLETSGLSILEALDSLVEHNAASRELVRLFTVLVGEAAGTDEHPAHDHFAERYRTVRAGLRSRLELGKANGEIAADVDCDVIATLVLAAMDGLQIQWLLDPELDMTAAFRTFSARLSESLATPQSRDSGGLGKPTE